MIAEVVPPALAGERIDRVVALITGSSRSEVASLVDSGSVRCNDRPVTVRSTRVSEGDVIEVDLHEPVDEQPLEPDATLEVRIVHEDEHLLVVDKDAGVVVHPGAGQLHGTLVQAMLHRYPEIADAGQPDRPGIVHRLDKGTSGLLLVARTDDAHRALVADLAARRVERVYRTLVWGEVVSPRGLVDAPIGRSARDPSRMTVTERGKPARTRYEVRQVLHRPVLVTELRCSLETGRTHQIRVHLASIGHPVVGDRRYGGARESLPLDRPFLHAEHLTLDHPVTGERISFESPLPTELHDLLNTLS